MYESVKILFLVILRVSLLAVSITVLYGFNVLYTADISLVFFALLVIIQLNTTLAVYFAA